MNTICHHCQEEAPDCMPDYEGFLRCSNCADAEVRARHLEAQARIKRIEAEWAEQDARFERDGKYVPYDPPTPSFTKKQAGQP